MTALALATLLLPGCSLLVDPGEARLCRILLAGQTPAGSVPRITATSALPAQTLAAAGGHATSGVAIAYDLDMPGPRSSRHTIACRFLSERPGEPAPRHLVAAWLDGHPIGAERLYFARRYWLELPESAAADPEPVAGLHAAKEIPRPAALAMQACLAGLPQASILALLAAAYALVHAIAARANLAYGELAALGGYGATLGLAASSVATRPAWALLGALVFALWAAGSIAAAAGRWIFVPLARRNRNQALVASLALALVLAEAARLAQGAGMRALPGLLQSPRAVARTADFAVTTTPMAMLVAATCLATALGIAFAARTTRPGRLWRAVCDDPTAAGLLGIDASRLAGLTYALAGALAGLAGGLAALHTGGVSHGTGLLLGLKAVIAATLAGAGSISGAATVGLLVGLGEALWPLALPIEHREAGLFALIVALLLARPGGIAGRPELER